MKLSEFKTEENMKILVYGESGSGKTVFAASLPPPILVFDFDGKMDSAAEFYKGQERLSQIEVEDMSRRLDESDPIEELNRIISKKLIPEQKSGKMSFATLVIDSLTTFSSATLRHIVRTNPGIKRMQTKQGVSPGMPDYGILKREFERLIPGILSLPCNIVMTGHIKIDKDELTGQIIRGPLMDGSFAQQLPIYFKEVYRSTVEKGEYMLQTKSDFQYNCRTQIRGMPDKVKSGYENVLKYIKGNNK